MAANLSPYGYAKILGSSEYNFGLNDFTIEFWTNQYQKLNDIQTLFEVSTNVSARAAEYQQLRFLLVNEQGNLNVYGIQTSYVGNYSNGNVFTVPEVNNANIRTFYAGEMLKQSDYTVFPNGNLVINHPLNGQQLIEPGKIEFQIKGPEFSGNINHYVSVERYNGNIFLFVDGNQYANVFGGNISAGINRNVSANINIPSTQLTSLILGNINITDSPALVTIGANRDGFNPVFGQFGDFRITNGQARHILTAQPQGNIYSEFTSANIGQHAADIVITGGKFIDGYSSSAPEELIPCMVTDTLNMEIYQTSNFEPNTPLLGWRILKQSVTLKNPIFTAISDGITTYYRTQFMTSTADSLALTVDGIAQSGNTYSVLNGNLSLTNAMPRGSSIVATYTGNVQYYSLGANAITVLSQPFNSTDTSIRLEDATGFITPTTNPLVRGIVFINGECISYMSKNGNVISSLIRGYLNTAIQQSYDIGTRVISGCSDRLLPNTPVNAGIQTWYNLGSDTPSNGEGLQNSNTIIATFLLNQGTILP